MAPLATKPFTSKGTMTIPRQRANRGSYTAMGVLACLARVGQREKHQGKFLMPKERRMVPLNFAPVQHPTKATGKAVHFPDKLSM